MLGRSLVLAALLLTVVMNMVVVRAAESAEPNSNPANSKTATLSKTADVATLSPARHLGEDSVELEPRPVRELKTRVLFITTNDCERCEGELNRIEKAGGEFPIMRARGWRIGIGADSHVQIVDLEDIPESVRKLEVREFPTVVCVSQGEVVRYFKSGCTTALDAWTFSWLIKGKNERPAATVPEPVRVQSTGSYRLRGNHWSIDGDWNPTLVKLVGHLRSASHASQLTGNANMETWSYEELRSLHDDLHEREMAGSGVSYTSGYQTAAPIPSDFRANRKILGK